MAPSELPVSRKDCFLETPHLAPSADIPLNLTHSDVLSKKASSSPALEVIYEHSQDQKSIFRLEQHQYESSAVVMPMPKATRKCHSKKWQSQHCRGQQATQRLIHLLCGNFGHRKILLLLFKSVTPHQPSSH